MFLNYRAITAAWNVHPSFYCVSYIWVCVCCPHCTVLSVNLHSRWVPGGAQRSATEAGTGVHQYQSGWRGTEGKSLFLFLSLLLFSAQLGSRFWLNWRHDASVSLYPHECCTNAVMWFLFIGIFPQFETMTSYCSIEGHFYPHLSNISVPISLVPVSYRCAILKGIV